MLAPPDQLVVMPGVMPIVGRTDQEARDKRDYLQELVHPIVGLSAAAQFFGDLSGYPLDAPVPEVDVETNAGQSNRQMWIERARRENMNVGQLLKTFATSSMHRGLVGSPRTIADSLEEWFTGEAADGFAVQAPCMPGSIFDFVDLVVPELQRRGLFHTEYEGRTLRENLGLDRPTSRYDE